MGMAMGTEKRHGNGINIDFPAFEHGVFVWMSEWGSVHTMAGPERICDYAIPLSACF